MIKSSLNKFLYAFIVSFSAIISIQANIVNKSLPKIDSPIEKTNYKSLKKSIAINTSTSIEESNNFINSLTHDDISILLTPQTLSSYAKLLEEKKKVKNDLKLLEEHEKRFNKILVDKLAEKLVSVSKLTISENIKHQTIEAYKAGLNKNKPHTLKLFQIKRKILKEIETLINFLIPIRNEYYFIGQTPYFTKSSDADILNKHLLNIIQLSEEESIIIECLNKSFQSAAAVIDKFQNE